MHVHFLDPYRPDRAWCTALDARVKLILTLGFILTAALTPPGAWVAYILLFAIILSVEILSELGVRYVLKRSALALPFVLAALPIIFTLAGPILSASRPWTLDAERSRPGAFRKHRPEIVDIGTGRDRAGTQHPFP